MSSRRLWDVLQWRLSTETFAYNHGQNILELYNVLVEHLTTSTTKLVYELPDELPNNLRFRILENKEILGKSQIWVEA